MQRLFITSVCLLCLAGAIQPAHASTNKDLERAEARATEGKAYFKAKLFGEAAEAFMDAYAIAKRPALVYNAARAREELNDNKRAVALFTMYMGLPGVKGDGKRAAAKRIAALQARIAAEKASQDQKDRAAANKAAADKAAANKAAADKSAALQQAQTAAAQKTAANKLGGGDSNKTAGPSSGEGAGDGSDAQFPLWRAVGAGSIALFAAAAQFNALGNAANARLENLAASSDVTAVKASRNAAQLWQSVAIGAGVAATGLFAWVGWDYFVAKTTKKRT